MNSGCDGLRTPSPQLQTVENARAVTAASLRVSIQHTTLALDKGHAWIGAVTTVEVVQHGKTPARRDAVDCP